MVEPRIKRLTRSVETLLRRLAADGPEVYRQAAPGEWSAAEVLAHVAEYLPYWARQAREVAARELPGLPFGRTHDDPERVAAVEHHARDPLEETLARVREALRESVATLRTIPPGRWTRSGRHAQRGEMTVAQLVDRFLLEHTEEHVTQAEAAVRHVAAR